MCYVNGLASCYLPILHGSGGWPQATAKLVAHFLSPSRGENHVPTNKDLRCRSRINKTGQMEAFGHALLWDGVTSIKFYKCTDGFADIRCRVSWHKPLHRLFSRAMLICQICIADLNSLWWKSSMEAESPRYSCFSPVACQSFYWAQVGLGAWKAVRSSETQSLEEWEMMHAFIYSKVLVWVHFQDISRFLMRFVFELTSPGVFFKTFLFDICWYLGLKINQSKNIFKR